MGALPFFPDGCISICSELWNSHRTPRLWGCLTLGVHFILELTSLKEPLTELVVAQRRSLGFIWKTVEREIFEKILNLCWRFPFTGFCLPLLGFSSSFRFICEGDYVSSFGSSAEDTWTKATHIPSLVPFLLFKRMIVFVTIGRADV